MGEFSQKLAYYANCQQGDNDARESNAYWRMEAANHRVLCRRALQVLETMVLFMKIRISDIPREIRVGSTGLYAYAFRVSRNLSDQAFAKDLQLLADDICHKGTSPDLRKELTMLFERYMEERDSEEIGTLRACLKEKIRKCEMGESIFTG